MIPYAIENIPIDIDDEIEDQGQPEYDLEGNVIDPNTKQENNLDTETSLKFYLAIKDQLCEAPYACSTVL